MKISYKAKLMGVQGGPNPMSDMDEDFNLQEGDVVTKMVDGVPSITFSNRVQQYIEKKMALTIVVKLLGKKIRFNA